MTIPVPPATPHVNRYRLPNMTPRWPGVLTAWAIAAAACAAPAALLQPAPERWVATWATAAQLTEPRNLPPEPGLAGNTLRQALRVSIGGSRLRVHFSNQYGPTPMEIRAARLARYAGAGAIEPASDRALSFGGRAGVTIPPGGTAVSDPLDYELEPMADLALTTWFGAVPGELTGHPGSRTTSFIRPGNSVSAPSLAAGVPTEHWYAMTGIDVVSPVAAAVAILGNSITDGRGSTTNGNDRWPDVLSRRLRASPATRDVAVLNLGTGGNCVLRACLGDAGIERFERDVLDQAGVRWAIVLEGVNDIGGARGEAASDSVARALIAAYTRMIERAHARGLQIYGATILPFAGSGYSSPEHEAARVTVNEWIRSSGAFDAVIDFDAALRDPADPTRLRPEADTGDHLHPNAEGYRLMGEAVDLALFGAAGPAPAPASRQRSPRERVSINSGWRFQQGDPPGNAVSLLYDARPAVSDQQDDRPAAARPEAAAGRAASARDVIKAWILPTGNAFIEDPARRFERPAGTWGADVAYVRADFDDGSWRRVDLPHDWAIEGPWLTAGPSGGMGRLPSWGVGWYRRRLDIPASDAGRSVFLDVDGAMSYSAVWLNGQLVGGWPYGYASWRLDLTPWVVPGGVNQLAIRLDNPPSSSRWYPGGGIYRNVWLTKTGPLHVGRWGTFVKSRDVSAASATVDLQVTIDNDSPGAEVVSVATRIHAADLAGRIAGDAVATVAPVNVTIAARASAVANVSLVIASPRLWGPPPTQQPLRYVAVTEVSHDGRLMDSYETRFGIRDLRFDATSGLFVNGERILLKGVNQHHDLGALGAAFSVRAAERQLELLRELGANAIRMAHNPPAPELLELTDRLGFLVIDELYDAWERGKTPLDFHLVFADWHEQDLRAWVRRDRNHPSVIVWSTGNEVGEQYTGEEGAALARRLRDIVREEDPARPTTAAMNYAKPDMPFAAASDVISLNYQGEGIRDAPEYAGLQGIRTAPLYPAFHEAFPDRLILSSENAAALSSRGEYLFPVTGAVSAPVRDGQGGDPASRQVSAYELYTAPFGSSADRVFASLERHPYVAGGFAWSGWDYLGEPTPYYSARSSYFGIIDLAGFPKDRFWLYQSRWRPALPMAHILPHWTWPERGGQVTPVHVFTSGDEAELFLNGRSLGRKAKGPFEHRLRWDDVVHEPGTLEVVSYRNGVRWATDVVRTAGAPAALELRPDRNVIRADGRDLSFVTVRVVDANGVLAPRARDRIRFTIAGPGDIVATDNGDPTSFEPFQAHERHAFNGLALVIVRSRPGELGRITLTATSDGLAEGTALITVTDGAGQGAAETGAYRNLFREAGRTDAEIRQKIDAAWQQLFHGDPATQTVFYWAGENEQGRLAYLSDINNQDVRSEGMSYGMMIAVQLDKKAEFDALWNWSRTYMHNADPAHPAYRYYSWSMNVDGTPRSESPAPDGEEYWVMALYFASGRWGDGAGIYNYRAMADELLDAIRNRGVIEGPWKSRPDRTWSEGPQFHPEHKMVRFTPDTRRPDHTDPSYHLPHFYELWGRWGPEKDRQFWLEAARISRDYFQKVTHPVTGLAPEYANYDGTPVTSSFNQRSGTFGPDAWRTAGNWSVDWSWWAADPREQVLSDRIQAFFESRGRYGNRYQLDGTPIDPTHSLALVATNAVASLAATDRARAMRFVDELWHAEIPSGRFRYYDGMWYLMALLHVSGEYRVWTPRGLPKP